MRLGGMALRTASSSTGRPRGRARSAPPRARSRSPPTGRARRLAHQRAAPARPCAAARGRRGPPQGRSGPCPRRAAVRGPTCFAATAGTAVAIHVVRRSRLGDTAQEIVAGLLAVAPAMLSVRAARSRRTTAPSTSRSDLQARRHRGEGARAVRLAPRRPAGRDRDAGNLLAARAPPSCVPRPASPRRSARSPRRRRSSAG